MGLPLDYAVRNLGRSTVRLLLSVFGSALVVLLLLSAGGFVRGMDRSLSASGSDQNFIFLGTGSEESVERSEISPSVPALIAAGVPGVRARLGVPYVSPEVHVQATVRPSADDPSNPQVLLRGITASAWLVHGSARIVQGRAPEAGRYEIAVGRLTHRRLGLAATRVAPGETLWFDDRAWSIVGVFEFPGSVTESEIWCPLTDLQIATRRESLSCVVVTIDGPDALDNADVFARQRLDLELVVRRESAYYAGVAALFAPVRTMVWVTALLMASGGILGGLNTMYAAFASRVREVGALQAMGFGRLTIIKSLVQESVLATASGTAAALAAGLVLLNGATVQFSLGAFGLLIDAPVVLMAIVGGLLVGVIGAIPAALRCLRMPIPEALKAH